MTVLAAASDHLVNLLGRISKTASVVDDAALRSLHPDGSLIRNVGRQADELQDVTLQLAAAGRSDVAHVLGQDALNMARKGGIMQAMREEGTYFQQAWHGEFTAVVNHVEDAIRQLT